MYQFVHVNSYGFNVSAKKSNKKYEKETNGRNVSEIIKELKRVPGFCDHVQNPDPDPEVLYGVNPEEIEVLARNYFDNTKTVDSLGRPRSLRKDANVLLAGVISLNNEINMIWDDYKESSIQWLKEKYGNRLVSVVQHLDEENPHIHFYCIPEIGEKFESIHEGKKAFASVGGKLQYKKEKAYTEAMKAYQEDFFLKVAAGYGLMKTGPRRQRLSNQDYWNQKREIELINQHKQKTKDEADLLLKNSSDEIKSQKKKAESEIILLKQKTIATATKDGENKGFSFAINEFNNKSYFNKIFFSRTFINDMENENKNLKLKVKDLHVRGEDLKDKYNRLLKRKKIYKNKVIYNDLITDFINNGEKPQQKEIEDDIRRNIALEIKRVENQQQQLNSRIKQVRSGSEINLGKTFDLGERIGKPFRVLCRNIGSFIDDFFRVKLFERMLKEEKADIKKYEYKEPKQKQKNNRPEKDRKPELK